MDLDRLAVELAERLLSVDRAEWAGVVADAALDQTVVDAAVQIAEGAEADSILDRPLGDATAAFFQPQSFESAGFRVVREIGRGGMGVVYLAEDIRLKRFVALKAIGGVFTFGGPIESRFLREARAAARLDHPNILQVLSSGVCNEVPYVVSAFIDGGTLADELSKLRSASEANSAEAKSPGAQGPGWVWQSAERLLKLARAVSFAHAAGVVHRDIKPGNVLLDADDEPLLCDFGIAGISDEPSITQPHERLGTARYMSPEQAGTINAEVGPRSDVYGLGATLFECLTLEPPEHAISIKRASHSTGTLGPNPRQSNRGVPRGLAWICQKALAPHPDDRFQSASEMAVALEAALGGRLRTPLPGVLGAETFLRRRPRIIAGSAGSAIAFLTIMIALIPRPSVGTLIVQARPNSKIQARLIEASSRLPDAPIRSTLGSGRWSLPEGRYRVAASRENGTIEQTVTISSGDSVEVNFASRPLPDFNAMVLIEGGHYTIGSGTDPASLFATRTVKIQPFWIDTDEVSNADYMTFVDATGADRPRYWPEPYDPEIDDLPVVGVSVLEAEAYAAWVGKRLPSDIEWEIAAAGGHRNASEPMIRLEQIASSPVDVNLQRRARFVKSENPLTPQEVKSAFRLSRNSTIAFDVTPSGLENMYWSARELTESRVPSPIDATKPTVIVKGASWADDLRVAPSLESGGMIAISSRLPQIGFRCAVSAVDR